MASNKIILRGAEYGGRQDEFRADAALKPGHFLTKNSDNEVLKQATAGADGPLLIAIEDRLKGGVITDAYAAGWRP